jgi:hypothetical protein
MLIVGRADGDGEGDEVGTLVEAEVGFWVGSGVCVGGIDVGVIAVGCGVVMAG